MSETAEAYDEDEATEDSSTDARENTEVRTIAPEVVPSKEEMEALCKDIKENFKSNVSVKPTVFRFKTSKDEDTGVETKREPLELPIPYPNVEGIIGILESGDEKQIALLTEAVEAVVTGVARSLISDDLTINATNLPVDKLSWEAISAMPKPQRSGGGIAKEVWEDFGKDYIKVMPEATGKNVEQVTRAAKLLTGKLASVKTNKPVLQLLVEQLTIYTDASSRADEFTQCVAFLVDKADSLLNATEEELLANL